jgi:hypothetical protein
MDKVQKHNSFNRNLVRLVSICILKRSFQLLLPESWDSSVGIVTGLRSGQPEFSSWGGGGQ